MCRSISLVKSSARPRPVAFDRTQVSAACIDSCITSPICPVMVKPPLPFILLASMNRMSPPAGVQASPTATPGRFALRHFSLHAHLDAAQELLQRIARYHQLFVVAFDHAPG